MGAVSGAGVGLSLLGFDPKRFFLVQPHVRETWRLLDCSEASFELGIGLAERRFRLDVEMSCEVHDGEQQVAELVEHAVVIRLGAELGQLLVYLGARA